MPLTREERQAHMRRVASLPASIANRFKPGPNYVGETVLRGSSRYVPNGCPSCGGDISECSKKRKGTCRSCLFAKRRARAEMAAQMRLAGDPVKQIAIRLGIAKKSAHHLLLKIKQGGRGLTPHARKVLVALLPKSCELCGYDRVLELAHIVSARNGGRMELNNILILCANCHVLFDRGRLTGAESDRLGRAIEERKAFRPVSEVA
jgi:5-methylcytosine-specific restriction endonuclease McrA